MHSPVFNLILCDDLSRIDMMREISDDLLDGACADDEIRAQCPEALSQALQCA